MDRSGGRRADDWHDCRRQQLGQHSRERAASPEAVEQLLADPNGRLTPLRGNELWPIALLELWLQQHGIRGPAA